MKLCIICGNEVEDDISVCPICQSSSFTSSNDMLSDNMKTETESDSLSGEKEKPTLFEKPKTDTNTYTSHDHETKDNPCEEDDIQYIPTHIPIKPKQEIYHGPVCYHHKLIPAYTKCARCGKDICKDCSEAYGVVLGEYAGKSICYDCTEEIVSDNVRELTNNKNKIKMYFIISLVGIVLGFIFGFSLSNDSGGSAGANIIVGLIFAGIGGVFLTAVKLFFSFTWQAIKDAAIGGEGVDAFIKLPFQIIGMLFGCVLRTISNTYHYIQYLIKTSGFIKSDTDALSDMRDYMEFTQVLSQNSDADIEPLMREGNILYGNKYAQLYVTIGEKEADKYLRQSMNTITENGELIRNIEV